MTERYIDTVRTPIQEWLAYGKHACQRDTAKHAKSAMNRHLAEHSGVHLNVKAVRKTARGKLEKLNGHTRSYCWENKFLPWPEFVYVEIWEVDTHEEYLDLFFKFDNPHAALGAKDSLIGILNYMKYYPNSARVKAGNWTTALATAIFEYNAPTPKAKEAVLREWLDAIKCLDDLNLKAREWNTAILGMVLLSFYHYGTGTSKTGRNLKDFWEAVRANNGTFNKGVRDAVYAMTELHQSWDKSPNGFQELACAMRDQIRIVDNYMEGPNSLSLSIMKIPDNSPVSASNLLATYRDNKYKGTAAKTK